ncbi:MAG: DNA polymerase [Dehalococcoidales bacterium]|jgi:DNA polymerase I-like protein with 3'-5' exonuclease and polymerase domains|nr:DNA polymerase [Syntrophales bacterium]MDX9802894.1 DNA polymerase [Dehalococcoidales bacterium]
MHYQKPLFDANSNWELPTEFPNLSEAKIISLDIETCDPDLKEKGPGVRTNGYIIGIAVGVPEGGRWYFPFGHAEGAQFDKEVVLRWAKKELCRPNSPKIGANLLYDIDYLYHAGVKVSGPFYDVQVAEPLLDENRLSYSLDSLAKDYLGEQKNIRIIEEACRVRGIKGDPRANLWRLPAKFVGIYAEKDVDLPLRIFEKQQKKLQEQNLTELFLLETKLIPMLLGMRQNGVRINVLKLEETIEKFKKEYSTMLKELRKVAGYPIDIWASASIARAYDKIGVHYERTLKTNQPSITKPWLEGQKDPVSRMIIECRKLDKFIGTFLEGQIKNALVKGRIHCQFNQLKSDNTGTVTGRFSATNPNLQFIPSRDPILGPLCRSLFIPDDGCFWGRADYSQIEIRILAHYAMGDKSDLLREKYINDPKVDYHQWCADEAGVSRKMAKTINFGIIYGMRERKLAEKLNIRVSQAKSFLDMYFKELPFIQQTLDIASRVAQNRGYVKTFLGRRRRFNLWQPADWELSKRISPLPDKEEMIRIVEKEIKYTARGDKIPNHGVKRAHTYKAFNAVDQGTAADLMKKAMVDIWESGVCDVLGFPLLTIHDELDWSVPDNKKAKTTFKEMVDIAEKALPLKVPVIVDTETGKSWGELE